MNKPRRTILRNAVSLAATAPTILSAKSHGYTPTEIDTRLTNGKTITKADLVTPALLLDLDALDANIAKLAAHAKAAKINLRPHGKTHKCVEIARRQMQAGAIGLCAATIREAEAFAAHDLSGDAASSAELRKWRQRLVEHFSNRGDQWVKGGKLQTRKDAIPRSPNFPSPLKPA